MDNAAVPVMNFLNYFVSEMSSSSKEDFLNTRIAGNYGLEPEDVSAEAIDASLYHLQLRQCPHRLKMFLANKVAGSLCNAVAESDEFPFPTVEVVHMAALDSLNRLCHHLIKNPNFIDSSALDQDLPFTSSEFAIKNKRHKMEDRHVVIHDLNSFYGLKDIPQSSYYAVFDGHAGIDAASFAAAHLHEYLVKHPAFVSDPSTAIAETYKLTDAQYCSRAAAMNVRSGCTAISALIQNKKLYLAWLGDSQAVLVKQGKAVAIMDPHVPDRKDERERIEKLGGFVFCHLGTWRVNGTLAVSRAIGDQDFKPFISSEPEITVTNLDGTEDFLVLACDGLWDCMTLEDASNTLYNTLVESTETSMDQIAQHMVGLSKQRGSDDNVTAIIVFLRNIEDIKQDAIKYCYPIPNNVTEDVPDFTESLIHNSADNSKSGNALERPSNLNDAISTFPCLKQNPRLAPEATSLSELPTPPIDEIILSDQFPQIYLSRDDSKVEDSPSSTDPEAIQIASSVVDSVIETAVNQISTSNILSSPESNSANANSNEGIINSLNEPCSGQKDSSFNKQSFDSDIQSSDKIVEGNVDVESANTESNSDPLIGNLLLDTSTKQCLPSAQCVEQSPIFCDSTVDALNNDNEQNDLFGERLMPNLGSKSAIDHVSESQAVHNSIVNSCNKEELDLQKVATDINVSLIDSEFSEADEKKVMAVSEATNKLGPVDNIIEAFESNVFSKIVIQNTDQSEISIVNIQNKEAPPPTAAMATVDIDLKSIPVGIPEAEGVVEDNDTDSEKDGGWSYVKTSTIDIATAVAASEKPETKIKQNNVSTAGSVSSTQKQPAKTKTLVGSTSSIDKSKVKSSVVKQVSNTLSSSVNTVKKGVRTPAEKKPIKITERTSVSKPDVSNKSRLTGNVKSLAPVRAAAASVKPTAAKLGAKVPGSTTAKTNSSTAAKQVKTESTKTSLQSTNTIKAKTSAAVNVTKSLVGTTANTPTTRKAAGNTLKSAANTSKISATSMSKPSATNATKSTIVAPRFAAAANSRTLASGTSKQSTTLKKISAPTSAANSRLNSAPKTTVAVGASKASVTVGTMKPSVAVGTMKPSVSVGTMKPSVSVGATKSLLKNSGNTINRTTKDDKNVANRLTRANNLNTSNKEVKTAQGVPKAKFQTKNRSDVNASSKNASSPSALSNANKVAVDEPLESKETVSGTEEKIEPQQPVIENEQHLVNSITHDMEKLVIESNFEASTIELNPANSTNPLIESSLCNNP